MSIQVDCECGMSFKLKDELAGRCMKCPSCGGAIQIPGSDPAAGAPARQQPAPISARGTLGYPNSRMRPSGPQKQTRFAMSAGAKWFIAAAVVIPTLIALATFGPVRVTNKLSEMEPVAESDVTDVVNKALYAWAEEEGYSLDKARDVPQTKGVILDIPIMPFTFPDTIDFQGRSTEGNFKGVYRTADRYIEAEIETQEGTILEVTSPMERGNRMVTRVK